MDRQATFPDFLHLSARVQQGFGGASLEEVVDALRSEGSPWAEECLRHMDAASPLRYHLSSYVCSYMHAYGMSGRVFILFYGMVCTPCLA